MIHSNSVTINVIAIAYSSLLRVIVTIVPYINLIATTLAVTQGPLSLPSLLFYCSSSPPLLPPLPPLFLLVYYYLLCPLVYLLDYIILILNATGVLRLMSSY